MLKALTQPEPSFRLPTMALAGFPSASTSRRRPVSLERGHEESRGVPSYCIAIIAARPISKSSYAVSLIDHRNSSLFGG